VVVLVESFGRKREFCVKIRLLTVLKIDCLCEVLENYFGIVENGIENGLTVWILRAKWWKTHFLKSWFLDLMLSKLCRDFCSRDTILLAKCSVVSGHKIAPRFLKSWHDFGEPDPSYFTILRPILILIGLWCKHESFR